ncbi:MAG: DUF4345 domain-containing protein [Pseudomonadales bacterium]|nr:DUF4345 domain-containing protein [Pseudomonadales bacterium]
MNQKNIHRYVLLFTGATLALIGVTYCIDPNLLLARYELSVAGASEDNMYRGAYGGLFITTGAAIAYGFYTDAFRQVSTIVALLFMGGFAIGRIASILALGIPHQQIVGLLVFEIVSSAVFIWLLLSQPVKKLADQS